MLHLVEMHKKLADRGLMVVTVSVDPADEPADVKTANDFLREHSPPFRNLLLDEPAATWQGKLKFDNPPCYYVFDRRGKWVRFQVGPNGEKVDHAAMDKVIQQMLDEK